MNQSFVPLVTTGFIFVSIALGVAQTPTDHTLTKSAVRECSRSFYQLGRELMQVPQLELNDPKLFFELINERIDDQRALIAILRERAKEETTISALTNADKALLDTRKSLRDAEMKNNYGEIAFAAGSSVCNSTPFREFFLKTLGLTKPTVGESITEGGN